VRIVQKAGQQTTREYSTLEIYFVRVAIRRGMTLSPSGVDIANRYGLWQYAGEAA
jgi:hypothetical protein